MRGNHARDGPAASKLAANDRPEAAVDGFHEASMPLFDEAVDDLR